MMSLHRGQGIASEGMCSASKSDAGRVTAYGGLQPCAARIFRNDRPNQELRFLKG